MEKQPPLRSQENPQKLEISLYQELLNCLEQEAQALARTEEEALLTLAGNKEAILRNLLKIKQDQQGEDQSPANEANAALLSQLKLQVARANERNHRIITASLEVIQEFLSQFQPPGPGTYRPEGRMEQGSGTTLFQRRV